MGEVLVKDVREAVVLGFVRDRLGFSGDCYLDGYFQILRFCELLRVSFFSCFFWLEGWDFGVLWGLEKVEVCGF